MNQDFSMTFNLTKYESTLKFKDNKNTSGVMVGMLTSSEVDCEFKSNKRPYKWYLLLLN